MIYKSLYVLKCIDKNNLSIKSNSPNFIDYKNVIDILYFHPFLSSFHIYVFNLLYNFYIIIICILFYIIIYIKCDKI